MKNKINRFTVVLGAVLMQFAIGAIYSWSLFNEPLHEKFHWDISSILLTYSLIIFVFALTTILSGRLLDKFGARKVAFTGAILYGTGVILTSFATSLIQLYLFYGVIAGIGVGFVYVCPLATCIKWFPQKKGLITGVVVGAFGLGSLIFKNIIEYGLNNKGVSETFLLLGIIYLILTLIGAFFLKEPAECPHNTHKHPEQKLRSVIKTKNFPLIWISYFLGCIGGLLVIGSATEIGITVAGLSLENAMEAVAVIALFNAGGRLFWGFISDHLGVKKTVISMFIISSITLITASFITFNLIIFYLFIAIVTFCFGGFLVIYPTITSEYFGIKNIGRNYGIVYQAYGIAALIGPLLLKSSSNFNTIFLIMGSLSLIGWILISQIKK